MKHKLSSMGRVAIALVLALSLTLVMAVPVAAIDADFSVDNDPTTVGRAATYTITFDTEKPLYLDSEDTITITFPDGTTVPDDAMITVSLVTVNGDDCAAAASTAQIGDILGYVEIEVSQEVLLAGEVIVVIGADAGIENPDDPATDLTLFVQTSEEPADIESAEYSATAIVVPTIDSVVGTAYQNSNDTIVITFSELVNPEGFWSVAFPAGSILCGTTELVLTGADFSPTNTEIGVPPAGTLTLTITLNENAAHLVKGTDNLKVTPVAGEIANVALDADVASVEVPGDVIGDSVAPTLVTLSGLDSPVKEGDDPTITATFSEAMQDKPTIAIDTTPPLVATPMTMGGTSKVWTHVYDVPTGDYLTATVTIVGKDLAGNSVTDSTNTFVIDNTAPFVAVTGITGLTTDTDTIEITFSEDVVATDGTIDADEVTDITLKKTDEENVTVNLTGATYAYASNVLTITLAEAGANTANKDYLLNGYTLTVDPHDSNRIEDLAGNFLDTAAIDGDTPVTGDLDVPTIIGIVGVSTNTIQIVFSELAVAFDGTWSANEFSVESPDGAPLNINNADFTNDTVATTVLIITLSEADAAVLVEGEVILVTPTADAVVDLAGNPLAAGEISSGEEAGWLAVWVDDVEAVAGWWDDPTHFDSIQAASDAVAIGGTVNVLDGSYTEDVNVTTAGIKLQAESLATIVDGGFRTRVSDITIDGFTIMNGALGPTAYFPAGIAADDPQDQSGHTFSNNVIIGADDIDVSKMGIYLKNGTDHAIDDNEIYGWGYGIGFLASSNVIITNNDIYDNIRSGIDVGDVSNNAVVEYNDIYGNNTAERADCAGIVLMKSSGWAINFNNIYDNFVAGLYSDVYGPQDHTFTDATNNWWGSPNGPGEDEANDVVEDTETLIDVDQSSWLDAPYPYGESTTTTTGQYAIDLEAGWNFISVPKKMAEASDTFVELLTGIDFEIWLSYEADPEAANYGWTEPANVEVLNGYWIKTSGGSITLSYADTAKQVPPSKSLKGDAWNAIGFSDTSPVSAGDTLMSIDGSWSTVIGWDAVNQEYETAIIAVAEGATENMDPFKGYWIWVTQDDVLAAISG